MKYLVLSWIIAICLIGCNTGTTPPAAGVTDTEAPSSPANLLASSVSYTQINVTWTASTDNVGVVGYQIWRDNIIIAQIATVSYLDTAVTASTPYTYSVKAYDSAGNKSAASNILSVTTLPDTVTVIVTGTVDGIDNFLGLLDNSVSIGSTITAIYKLSLSSTPSPYSQPNMTDYFNAFGPNDVSITVGNYTFKSGSSTQLTMVNGGTNADGLFDGWYLNLPSTTVIGPLINASMYGFVSLYDPSASALDSTNLVPVPQLSSWSSKRIGIARQDSNGLNPFIFGEITDLKVLQ